MILHYAHLCAAAGGVDAFLIGSELRGLTQVRERRVDLSGGRRARRSRGRRARRSSGPARSSATPPTGRSTSGTTRRTARATSSSTSTRSGRTPTIDFVGIDNYMPLVRLARRARPSRRRAAPTRSTDLDYLRGNIEGGEGFDWFYASAADREAQVRTPITDGAAGKPWVFRYKDLRALVVEPAPQPPGRGRERRADGVGAGVASRSASPRSAARRSTAAPNQPNVFYDPKSSESFLPYFSRGWRDDAIQRRLPRGGARLLGRAGEQPDRRASTPAG